MAPNDANPLGIILSQVLSDPQKMQQIQQMASALGLGAPPQGTAQTSQQNQSASASQPNFLEQLQQAFSKLSQSDPKIDFLRSMKPLLSERRAQKVEDAIHVMQLIELLPMIKQSGLFFH